MPNLPLPTQTDVAIQDQTTGAIDFLKFEGNHLVASNLQNYGLGAGFRVVAQGDFNLDGHIDLVVQNAAGFADFLFLDANAHLVSSNLSTVALPRIVGEGNFGTQVPGQGGPTLVSQLANGELDFLGFNTAGTFIASDQIATTIGLARAVGVGESNAQFPMFLGVGTNQANGNDTVMLQLADGSLDALGFSGNFGNGTLEFSNSFLLPGTAGDPTVKDINPDFGANFNAIDGGGHETAMLVAQTAAGQIDMLYIDSGYNDAGNLGVTVATDLLAPSFAGFDVVNAGQLAHQLFPVV